MNEPTSADLLRSIVERLEMAQSDADSAKEDLKQIYAEAKGRGFDVPILKKVMARKKRGLKAIEEEQQLVDLYEGVISGQMTLPLSEAA